MTLPLPYTLGDDDDPIQGNFDAIKKRFPLTRKDIASSTITRDRLASEVENVPRFRVYRNAALSGASGTAVQHDTEELDSHGWFDTATGLFTPQRAGTYRFSWAARANAALTADNWIIAYLAMNGSVIRAGQIGYQRGSTPVYSAGTAQLDANGTTDNFSVIFQHNQGGSISLQVGLANVLFNFFDGEWIGAS